jgi:hypothetical protein
MHTWWPLAIRIAREHLPEVLGITVEIYDSLGAEFGPLPVAATALAHAVSTVGPSFFPFLDRQTSVAVLERSRYTAFHDLSVESEPISITGNATETMNRYRKRGVIVLELSEYSFRTRDGVLMNDQAPGSNKIPEAARTIVPLPPLHRSLTDVSIEEATTYISRRECTALRQIAVDQLWANSDWTGMDLPRESRLWFGVAKEQPDYPLEVGKFLK